MFLKKVTGEVIRFNKIMDICMISVVKHNNIYLKMVIKIKKGRNIKAHHTRQNIMVIIISFFPTIYT